MSDYEIIRQAKIQHTPPGNPNRDQYIGVIATGSHALFPELLRIFGHGHPLNGAWIVTDEHDGWNTLIAVTERLIHIFHENKQWGAYHSPKAGRRYWTEFLAWIREEHAHS